MADIGRGWHHLADRNPLVGFVDACLRGAAQVVLQNNPLSGLLILAGLAWGAVESGSPGSSAAACSGWSWAPRPRWRSGSTWPAGARGCSASARC
ncbi:urea transporter [Micromonospora sp. NPDC049836]|uniref:urea transporter n=1 Tax=Micromonospora sp. NPDC049836 TaxID=3364274 RepID=UPI0037A79295